MFDTLNIASSGLSAQNLRLNVISNNIANANTTRNASNSGPFRRDTVIMQSIPLRDTLASSFLPQGLQPHVGKGVRVERIQKDTSPLPLRYDPFHPDAIQVGPKRGYVELSNVNIVKEMTNMIAASRSYEANAQVVISHKQMFNKTLELGRIA